MKSVCFGLLMLGWVNCGYAQSYLRDEVENSINLSQPTYLIDDQGKLLLRDVMEMPFPITNKEALDALTKLNRNRRIWMRVEIELMDTLEAQPALRTSSFSEVRYYLTGGEFIDSCYAGAVDIGNDNLTSGDPFVFDLRIRPGEKRVAYIQVGHYSRSFRFSQLWVECGMGSGYDSRADQDRNDHISTEYIYILFCGLLIFQFGYVLFQWILVRRREYFYYAMYILAAFLYFYGRYSVQLARIPGLAQIDAGTMIAINDVLLVLPTLFYIRFARHFVDLAVFDPRLVRYFRIFEVFLIVSILVLFLIQNLPNDLNNQLIFQVILAVQFLFSLYAIFRVARQKRTVARFLVVGSSFALLAHVGANISPLIFENMLRVMDPLTITMGGIMLELAIFNTGLLFKAKEAEVDKVAAQRAHIYELLEKQQLQERYMLIRDKIASDLHDDVGSSLSSINIYSYAARQKLKENDQNQTKLLLENIEKTVATTLNAMSDLVWAINPLNDSGEKLIERIRSFAFEILAACHCRFVSDVHPSFYNLTLSQNDRKNILLILKEAVNNTAKYASATEVSLRITQKDSGEFLVCLSDNGTGFDVKSTSGNGMRTMKKRASELSNIFKLDSNGVGTSVYFEVGEKWLT